MSTTPTTVTTGDAYAPRAIAQRVRDIGVTKARTDVITLFVLAGLAGAFISLGALFFTVVVTDPTGGFGVTRLIGGFAFSLGLILVVVAGAELFTGNNLVAMAWASRMISSAEPARNWVFVYIGNTAGALGTVVLVRIDNVDNFGGGAVGQKTMAIAESKTALDIPEAIALGVLAMPSYDSPCG